MDRVDRVDQVDLNDGIDSFDQAAGAAWWESVRLRGPRERETEEELI